MNPRLPKINDEIEKLRQKLTNYQNRLRDLERLKTELENADIIALVRGVDMPADDFADFVRAFREQRGLALPEADGLPGGVQDGLPGMDGSRGGADGPHGSPDDDEAEQAEPSDRYGRKEDI